MTATISETLSTHIDELRFRSQTEKHELSSLYADKIARMGNAGRNGGEYYTPRPLIRAMIQVVKPQVGERIYDGACGSAGFLCEFDKFMAKLLEQPEVEPLLSDEHFSVDGTLIEAWASHKSFKPKDGDKDDDGSNFHGQKRKNDTHASTSDPDAKLYRKAAGREARLGYMGHAVMENRNGPAVAGTVSQADGTAERRASEALLKRKARRRGRRITVGEDKAYDCRDHVTALRP
jgi:hypothetical protein